jgi:hypothetical protein
MDDFYDSSLRVGFHNLNPDPFRTSYGTKYENGKTNLLQYSH